MISIRLVTIFLSLSLSLAIFTLIRKDHLRPGYAISWVIVAIVALIFGFFPGLGDIIGHRLGIYYPPVLFLSVGLVFILVKMLIMDLERSRHEQQIRKLARKITVLEKQIQEIKDEIEKAEKLHKKDRL